MKRRLIRYGDVVLTAIQKKVAELAAKVDAIPTDTDYAPSAHTHPPESITGFLPLSRYGNGSLFIEQTRPGWGG